MNTKLAIAAIILVGMTIILFVATSGDRRKAADIVLPVEFSQHLPQTIAVLKEHFPEDYETMAASIIDLSSTEASPDSIKAEGSKIVAAIRRKHGAFTAMAPDEDLKRLLNKNITLLEEVQDKEGDALCNKVALAGANVLPVDILPKYFVQLDATAAATFQAIAAGRKAQIAREPASSADWTEIVGRLRATGITEDAISVLSGQRGGDPRYCRMTLLFMAEMQALESAGGERVRADFAGDIGSS